MPDVPGIDQIDGEAAPGAQPGKLPGMLVEQPREATHVEPGQALVFERQKD